MRRQVILVLIGVLVVLAAVGEPSARQVLAFWSIDDGIRTENAQNQLHTSTSNEYPTFLTGPNPGTPEEIVTSYLQRNRAELGIEPADLQDVVIKNQYVTEYNGVTHIYLRQRLHGIELFNGDINVNIGRNGEVINIGNRFVRNLAIYANTGTPEISAQDAVVSAARQMNWEVSAPLNVIEDRGGPARELLLSDGGVSSQAIPATLLYVRLNDTQVRLTWNVRIYQAEGPHVWNLAVDAVTGALLLKQDLIVHEQVASPAQTDRLQEGSIFDQSPIDAAEITNADTNDFTEDETTASQVTSPLRPPVYGVFALPVEHPNDGVGLPDSQTRVRNPADATASPFGWHDIDGVAGHEFLDTRGNNVSVQEDRNGDNIEGFRPTGRQPNRFNFLYPFSPDLGPTEGENPSTAIVNLFFTNNFMHDLAYQYGFDEVSGNFQQNTYERGGMGGDAVQADAHDNFDNGSVNNAFWEITPDGTPPRMGMYVFNLTTPNRDSALDNGIIVHEYAHGISTRLVGGPANVSCLFSGESMGEGWSDWFALVTTAKPGQTGEQPRSMGTYVLGQPSDGPGIRRVPYSTDMRINAQTYDWLKRSGEVHDVGEVWATMLWEVYWELVQTHGYDPNIFTGTGGNNLALRLVMDGMKLTACDPGFVDARNALLLADQIDTGAANQCTIWAAFAKRGLGYSADQGSPFSAFDGTEAFDMPPACRDDLALSKHASAVVSEAGESLTYTIEASNYTSLTLSGLVLSDPIPAGTTYVPGSASDGGTEANGVITWQLPNLNPDEGGTRTFQVSVNRDFPDAQQVFFDDVEGGGSNWEATGLWQIQDDSEACGNSASPTHSWYFGQAPDCLYTDNSAGQLTTVAPIVLPEGVPTLKFMSWTEYETCCDQGQVLVSTNGVDYLPVWSTTSSSSRWREESVDLSDYRGQSVWLRFEFRTDISVVFRGWYVDDIEITVAPTIDNVATLTSNEGVIASAESHTRVIKVPDIEVSPTALEVEVAIGSAASRTLTISNTGTAPLTFGITARSQPTSPLRLINAQPAAQVQVPAFQPQQQNTPSYARNQLVPRQEVPYQPKVEGLNAVTGVKVLLLAAANVVQIQTMLDAYPDLDSVDVFDARVGTPALSELLVYDTVVVISNEPFADSNAIGNLLADYVDNDGTVVQTVPTFFDPGGNGWGVRGRWLTEGYSPFNGTGDWFAGASLGTFNASHPIMQGVNEASDFFRQVVELAPGAELVASWTDDEFVATKDRVVALNTFLPDGFLWTGDVDLIVHNSIIWLQDERGEPAPWLSTNPVSGTIAGGSTQTVEVSFDASLPEITVGELSGSLRIRSNDPDESIVNVPVTMHVFGPELSILGSAPTWFGRPAEATVNFTSNGFDIAATSFSVDFDESCLSFDPTDADLDGIPDAITFATPAGLQVMASVDLSDVDGEIDVFVADTALPLSTLEDGTLATIRFATTCLPSGEPRQVNIGFSSDPRASFSDLNGVSIPATAIPGTIEVGVELSGDCNQDDVVDSADVISCVLELFDGDGAFWLDAPGGTFPGSPQGCDSNKDSQIDAADMVCTVLITFQGQSACSAAGAGSSVVAPESAATLTIRDAIPVEPGEEVSVPIHFASNGNEIAATVFVLTYDATRLYFDPTDGNGDGIPDAVTLHVPSRFARSVTVDGEGRIQIALTDVALPLMPLTDGPLATFTFTAAASAEGESVPVSFADDYPVSAGSTRGTSLPVITEDGSVRVEAAGPASTDPKTPEPAAPEPQAPEPQVPEPQVLEPQVPEPKAPAQVQHRIYLPVIPK